jgi:hypothetical protein
MADSEKMTDKQIVDWIISCRNEADEAKRSRVSQNKLNYDMYHLKYDFSHKEEGQSQEVLSKQSMAVEQIKSFFQQALADLGDWWKCEPHFADNEQGLLVRPHEVTKLTNYFLQDARYFSHVGNSIQSALLASLAISKTSGCLKTKPKFVARKKGRGASLKRWVEKVEDKSWEMKFDSVRAENYYPDPKGKGLYEIEDMWPDFHELLYLAESDEDYDLEMIKGLSRSDMSDVEENSGRSRETGQDIPVPGHRVQPKVTEYWGTILHPTSGEVMYENIQAVVVNDTHLVMQPRPNPLWHQKSPYTASPLLEVANSVWHKALMDAPTMHNRALIEIYNLMVDAAMKQVHAISQLRKDALDNPAQVQNGIPAGTTLMVNSMLPPGAKVMESVTSVVIPPEAFNMSNLMQQEFNASALTSDLRAGVTPFREQKATAVVEQSQTITSVFQGMAKNWEARQSMRELELAWMTTCQNWDLIDKEVFKGLFGPQRGEELAQLAPQDVFANTVGAIRFKVFGISLTLSKSNDFRKLTTLLQTVFSNPALTELFMQKYDPAKLLGEIMTSLDIDKEKIELPAATQATMNQPQQGAPEPQPDMNSQIPQAAGLSDMAGGGIPQASFPGSPAMSGMSNG